MGELKELKCIYCGIGTEVLINGECPISLNTSQDTVKCTGCGKTHTVDNTTDKEWFEHALNILNLEINTQLAEQSVLLTNAMQEQATTIVSDIRNQANSSIVATVDNFRSRIDGLLQDFTKGTNKNEKIIKLCELIFNVPGYRDDFLAKFYEAYFKGKTSRTSYETILREGDLNGLDINTINKALDFALNIRYAQYSQKESLKNFIERACHDDKVSYNNRIMQLGLAMPQVLKIETEQDLTKTWDIFLCYHGKNVELAERIYELLYHEHNITCFFSQITLRDLDTFSYKKELIRAMDKAKLIIVISSQELILSNDRDTDAIGIEIKHILDESKAGNTHYNKCLQKIEFKIFDSKVCPYDNKNLEQIRKNHIVAELMRGVEWRDAYINFEHEFSQLPSRCRNGIRLYDEHKTKIEEEINKEIKNYQTKIKWQEERIQNLENNKELNDIKLREAISAKSQADNLLDNKEQEYNQAISDINSKHEREKEANESKRKDYIAKLEQEHEVEKNRIIANYQQMLEAREKKSREQIQELEADYKAELAKLVNVQVKTTPTQAQYNSNNNSASIIRVGDINTSEIKVGKIIQFGVYGIYAGKQAGQVIEWRVLDREGDKALLVSDKIITLKRYNADRKNNKWEKSDIRRWLNGEFYDGFTSSEKSRIIKDNGDKITLLTVAQVKKYFKDDNDRIARRLDDNSTEWYWLKDAGSAGCAASVSYFGFVDSVGYDVDRSLGARPALWLNLKSAI